MLLIKSFALSTLLTWALLVGLVSTTPVNCLCGPNQHLGHAVHPRLPHDHPNTPASPDLADDLAFDSQTALSAVHGELLSFAADVVGLGFASLAGGDRLVATRFGRSPSADRPTEHFAAPPTDPPRPSRLFS
jgi:hypothetical protein